MKAPQLEYVDGAFGALHLRNNPVRVSEVAANVKKCGAVECYSTYFRYTIDLLKHVHKTKTVKEYEGEAFADYFVLDIDSADLNLSLERARKVVEFFIDKNIPDDDIKVWFSGAKGFHICLDSTLFDLEPLANLPAVYKAMSKMLSEDFGIELDPTVYDGMRLWRIEDTVNQKTGLYKIRLSLDELFGYELDGIKRLAEKPRGLPPVTMNGITNEYMMSLFLSGLEQTEKKQKVVTRDNKQVVVGRNAKPCIARILAGVADGERNNCAIRLACHYRKEGMPETAILGLLQGWNELNDPPLEDSDLETVAKSSLAGSYDFGCHDPILQSFCTPDCILMKRKEERVSQSKDLVPLGSLAELYAVSLRQTERVYLGIKQIDKAIRGAVPGEVITLLARSGTGKTALMMNMMWHQPKENPCIFFSMEMPSTQIYERAASIVTGFPAEELEKLMDDPEQRADIAREVSKRFEGTYIIDKDRLTLDEIDKLIEAAEREVIHAHVKVIFVDHLGRMKVKGMHKEYDIVSELALGIKELAKKRNLVVVQAVQVGREAGGTGKEEIDMAAARGSGQVEEGADVIIGMHRPNKDDENLLWDIAQLYILKNRKGGIARAPMKFHRSVLQFEPVETSQEKSTGKPGKKSNEGVDL